MSRNTKIRIYRNCIVIDYINQGKNLRYRTGITGIKDEKKKLFDSEKGRFLSKHKEAESYNNIIEASQNKIESLIIEHHRLFGKWPKIEEIKEKLTHKGKDDVLALYKEFTTKKWGDLIRKAKDNNKIEGKDIAKLKQQDIPSFKDYKSLENALKFYNITKPLTLAIINNFTFFEEFANFLSIAAKKVKENKYQGNLNSGTINKRLTTLNTFLSWLESKGHIVRNPNFNDGKINKIAPRGLVEFVYLEDEEIKFLWNMEFDETVIEQKNYKEVRDIFLFMIFTGMRYSDVCNVNELCNYESGSIIMKAHKTSQNFQVPLNKNAEILFHRIKNYTKHSNQVFNRQLYGFFDKNNLFKYPQKGVNLGNKIEHISSHTGRRTFITRCLLNNVPLNEIMKYVGHRQLKTILHYIEKFKKPEFEYVKKLEI